MILRAAPTVTRRPPPSSGVPSCTWRGLRPGASFRRRARAPARESAGPGEGAAARADPVELRAQPLAQAHPRLPAEVLLRAGRVGARAPDIADAVRVTVEHGPLAREVLEQ